VLETTYSLHTYVADICKYNGLATRKFHVHKQNTLFNYSTLYYRLVHYCTMQMQLCRFPSMTFYMMQFIY